MDWLRKARRVRGISAQQLADMTGLTRNYIAMIESGRKPMTDSAGKVIYEALGFTPEDVPFNTSNLIEQCKQMGDGTVTLVGKQIGEVIYFTDISPAGLADGMDVRLDYALRLLCMQRWLFDY